MEVPSDIFLNERKSLKENYRKKDVDFKYLVVCMVMEAGLSHGIELNLVLQLQEEC